MSFKDFLAEKALVKGAFHRWLGKSLDEPITAADIAKGKAAGGHPEKMAVQAQNFREEVVNEASPVTGTRVVSRHGVGSPHHAEVRYNKDYEEYSVHHYKHGKHMGEGPVSYHGNDKEDAKNTAEHEVKRHNSVKEEVMVNEKITDSKESLEKAIAAAERKAAKAQSRENSSYIEALKKALRRIKGRKNIKSSEVGMAKSVAEDTTSAPSESGTVKRAARIKFKRKTNESTELVTELSKKVLSSYRTKALGQLKGGKGDLKGKDEKRFNGVAKSVKEETLDELSKATHANYRDSAKKDGLRHRRSQHHRQDSYGRSDSGAAEHKKVADKRNAGVERSNRLTKEEEQFDAELDAIYEADTAFHSQDEFVAHAQKNGHHVRTVLRGTQAHLHAKHLESGKTHGLYDVKKDHGVYSSSPLHVEAFFDGDDLVLVEDAGMSDAAHELVHHADNHGDLHRQSHMPIIHNLKKKAKKGVYDSEKAKKLWGYHADRAAQSYHKEHGSGGKWHHMFSTHDRKQAASHWEAHHRHEVHESVTEENKPVLPGKEPSNPNYNETAVNKAIARNPTGKIGKKEARMIHRLLKGRH